MTATTDSVAARIKSELLALLAGAGLTPKSSEQFGEIGQPGTLHVTTDRGLRVFKFAPDGAVTWARNAANFDSLFSPSAAAEIRQLVRAGADAGIVADRVRDEGYEIDPKRVEALEFNLRTKSAQNGRTRLTLVEAFAVDAAAR